MKKVFYLCVESACGWWTPGKEYAATDDGIVFDDKTDRTSGPIMDRMSAHDGQRPLNMAAGFSKIERDCFEAHNQTWFRRTPGETMPCDPDALVDLISTKGLRIERASARFAFSLYGTSVSGWRYSEQAGEGAPESFAVAGDTLIPAPECSGTYTQAGVPMIGEGARSSNEDMKQADIAAVTGHGHLSPGQRKHIDAMEAKQAAKESGAAEREQANLAERGKALESAAQAMDSVRDVHGHRLGWTA